MTNISLKQLRYFEALAHHGHFGHAAAASSISQPALSVQIKELEAELGATLFERGPRKVRLTIFGEEFALHVLIGHLGKSHPQLDIHVRETLTPRLITELNEGKLDTAILALPVSEPSLTEVALFSENFVLVRPQSDARKPTPDGESLRDMRLLLLEEGHCFRDQALAFCNIATATPREGLDGSSMSTLVQMVGAGIGVTLIPEMAIDVETRSANVAVARFQAPKPSRTVGMVWRKTSPLSEQLTQISQVVRQSAEALFDRPIASKD